MKNNKKYAVIGGKEVFYSYGVVDTLHKAKILASKNVEYRGFDNWSTPDIYDEADCMVVQDDHFGEMIVPKYDQMGARYEPILIKVGTRWRSPEEARAMR